MTYHNVELEDHPKEKLNLIQPTLPRDPEIIFQWQMKMITFTGIKLIKKALV